jgi:hypothetical protein
MYALPEHKLGVIVLANSNTANRAIDRIATETLALALEAKTGINQPKRAEIPAADPPWPADKLQPYAGDYATVAGFARIRLDGNRLRADAFGRSFDLVPRSDGQLAVTYSLFGLFRIDLGNLGAIGFSRRSVAGHEVLVASVGAQEMLVGERIQPPSDLGRWRQRLGPSVITNAGEDHTFVDGVALVEERGFLLAELKMTDGPTTRIPLQIISDNEAVMLGPLAEGGGTLRCAQTGDTEQCVIAGYSLQRTSH